MLDDDNLSSSSGVEYNYHYTSQQQLDMPAIAEKRRPIMCSLAPLEDIDEEREDELERSTESNRTIGGRKLPF